MAKRGVSSYGEETSNYWSRKGGFLERVQPAYILIILVVVFILTILGAYIASSEDRFDEVPTCGDGSFYNTCSLDKPYFCEDGVLVERASVCGCVNGNSHGLELIKQGDGCILPSSSNPLNLKLDYFLNGKSYSVNFTVYEGVSEQVGAISREIYYKGSEIPFRSDFKLKSISDETQRFNVLSLVKNIQNLAPDSKVDQARIAISIVQNIPYGFSDKITTLGESEVNYTRYPYEVLFESEGICGEKSSLMALLLKELGYGTSIFYFADENHEAVGISCPVGESLYGSGFCFVETGGPAVISDISMEFVGGLKLSSVPQVMLISNGISLPEGIDEYGDAKTLSDIRNKNLLGYFKFWRYNDIAKKYNLDGSYELD